MELMPLIVKYNDQQADNHQIQEAVATRNGWWNNC